MNKFLNKDLSGFPRLTRVEWEYIKFFVSQDTVPSTTLLSKKFCVKPKTVKFHLYNIMKKFNLKRRIDLYLHLHSTIS